MLNSGTKVGSYEVVAAIGAGGMGEVYRARDPKLGRDVAIKVLPEAFARDAERMARFQREAKVLASLSHPNIATIYGLEDSGTTRALVMELVEGPTLADRIKAGPIPVDEAVRIARQIADALEYAHERGIIHRDLKPANVKVTNDDIVKVLDFGLAKALEGDPSSIDISTSPTISRMATQQGVLLGTAAYMSPEQAKAKPADRRADIWAFGCVLYEMLTGKVAFPGDSVTDTLAGVIRAEPDWSQLPSATPMRVRVLLQRCLQKDPKERLQAIGDARIALNEVLSGAPDLAPVGRAEAAVVPLWSRALPWAALAACLTVALVALAFVHFRGKPAPPAHVYRYDIATPDPRNLRGALSPDGTRLVFSSGLGTPNRLWLRRMDSLEAHPIEGTEGTRGVPFWSPDSRFIAFGTLDGKLKKIDTEGGPAQVLCDSGPGVFGGFWTPDGKIVFGDPGRQPDLWEVPAEGGISSPLPGFKHAGDPYLAYPVLLPDGKHFLYASGGTTSGEVYVGSLDKPGEQNSKRLLSSLGAAFVPSPDDSNLGYLLFVRGTEENQRTGALMVQLFDLRKLALVGDPVPIAEQASYNPSASRTGTLVYGSGTENGQLTWFDREGKILGTVGEPTGLISSVRVSPDGTHAAVGRNVQNTAAIWLLDFARGTSTRFTFGSGYARFPVWSPDGKSIIFSDSDLALYQKPASGAGDEQLLLKAGDAKFPDSWSSDGRFFLYSSVGAKGKSALWVLPLSGDKKPVAFLSTEFDEMRGRFSPDGRWVAYVSDESGRNEIYVRPFSLDSSGTVSNAGGKWLISTGGGTDPRWRGDGKELYYLAADGSLMAVELSAIATFQAGVPKVLFRPPLGSDANWDVTADGKRFLFPAPTAQSAQAHFTVVLNWTSLLRK